MTNILDLPNELLNIIFMRLNLVDGVVFKRTCKRMNLFQLMIDPHISIPKYVKLKLLKIPQYRFVKQLNTDHILAEYNHLYVGGLNEYERIKLNIKYLEMKLDLLKYNEKKYTKVTEDILSLRENTLNIIEQEINRLEEFINAYMLEFEDIRTV